MFSTEKKDQYKAGEHDSIVEWWVQICCNLSVGKERHVSCVCVCVCVCVTFVICVDRNQMIKQEGTP